MPTFRDWIAGRTAETAIQDADELYVRDDSTDTSKRVTWAGVKTALDAQYAPLRSSLWIPPGRLRAVTVATETASVDTPVISLPSAGSSECSAIVHPVIDGVAHWSTFSAALVGMALDGAGGNIVITALAVNGYDAGDAVTVLPGPAGATFAVGGDKVVQDITIDPSDSWPAGKDYVRVGFTRYGSNGSDTAGDYAVLGLLLVQAS